MGDVLPSIAFLSMTPSPELLERCRKDDRRAHYELYSMCFSFILSVCRRYYVNKEDMESTLNQVYVKIVKNISGYIKKSERIPFELWVRRIVINYIIDEFRKNKRYRESFDFRELQDAEEIHPSFNPMLDSERLEEILDAIRLLPEMNRTVFNLFVVDGYKHEEISRMLKISTGTSKAHLHRAKMKLRDVLENEWKKKQVTRNIILQ